MTINNGKWKLGDVVTLPRNEQFLKKSGSKSYERLVGSRYICVREETEGQRGILVKVLGKIDKDAIMFQKGEPFCKDDVVELFIGKRYFSYQFPWKSALKEVLEIVQQDTFLQQCFDKAKMHFDPAATFWVRDSATQMLLLKKPQYYDTATDQLHTATDSEVHQRLTMAYFYKDRVTW